MASPLAHTMKPLKGLDSRKSNSWWWESHIGPRNSKWLAENLEVMDQNHKLMLKLIEGDGDSLAKKAEMYYQRRPELLSYVDEFHRMYKSLAERYENLAGDLRKHLLPELQSQVSAGFDSGSDTTPVWPPQDQKIRRGFSHRAAGFDFFLGSGRPGLDRPVRGDETSSVSDSETESDVSSLHSYATLNTGEEGLQVRPMELEGEAYGEEKLQIQEHANKSGPLRRNGIDNMDDVHSKIIGYEEELKMAKEKILQSEDEIFRLKIELQKFTSSESPGSVLLEFPEVEINSSLEAVAMETDAEKVATLHGSSHTTGLDVSQPEEVMQTLIMELRNTKGTLQALDKEAMKLRKENREATENIQKMQDMLKMAQKDAVMCKGKLETEKRHASKLQERIARYKTSLADRENEVRDLKEVISDASRKYQLHAEISRLEDEKTSLEERVREWEVRCNSLESQHGVSERKLNDEIEHLKADIAEKAGKLEVLEIDLDAYKLKYDSLVIENNELNARIGAKDELVVQMEKQLQDLISEKEVINKRADELRSRVEELGREVEWQKVLILEVAEAKREAIRQLCFSLEHYRIGYQQLRQAFTGLKQLHVLAS